MDENPAPQPKQLPQPPSFQFQLPVIATNPRQKSNTEILLEANRDLGNQGNAAEEKVALQIILISSAILAIVSAVGFSKIETPIALPAGILLVIAVLGLGVSLVAGITHFITERAFWYGNGRRSSEALKLISNLTSDIEKEKAAYAALGSLEPASNRAAFWVQILSFLVGVIGLVILIIAAVITHIR
jgi:hypothetical protein